MLAAVVATATPEDSSTMSIHTRPQGIAGGFAYIPTPDDPIVAATLDTSASGMTLRRLYNRWVEAMSHDKTEALAGRTRSCCHIPL